MLLLRLSHASLWLAALSAGLALALTGPPQRVFGLAAAAWALVAYAAWRFDLGQRLGGGVDRGSAPPAFELDAEALARAASLVAQRAAEAPSLHAALHVVAETLRSELGARQSRVFDVDRTAGAEPRLAELFSREPHFRALPRRVAPNEETLVLAIRGGHACATLPGALAVPVGRSDGGRDVLGVLELRDIGMRIEDRALAALLAAARSALRAVAAREPPAASGAAPNPA